MMDFRKNPSDANKIRIDNTRSEIKITIVKHVSHLGFILSEAVRNPASLHHRFPKGTIVERGDDVYGEPGSHRRE